MIHLRNKYFWGTLVYCLGIALLPIYLGTTGQIMSGIMLTIMGLELYDFKTRSKSEYHVEEVKEE